jgi:hypothetical protein
VQVLMNRNALQTLMREAVAAAHARAQQLRAQG